MGRSVYKRCVMDRCCNLKKFDSSYIILLFHVDDMLIVGASMKKTKILKKQLSKEFKMKDLDASKEIIIIRVSRDISEDSLKFS